MKSGAKLMDFGLAKQAGAAPTTSEQLPSGTSDNVSSSSMKDGPTTW
jgi:hypothetical protein